MNRCQCIQNISQTQDIGLLLRVRAGVEGGQIMLLSNITASICGVYSIKQELAMHHFKLHDIGLLLPFKGDENKV